MGKVALCPSSLFVLPHSGRYSGADLGVIDAKPSARVSQIHKAINNVTRVLGPWRRRHHELLDGLDFSIGRQCANVHGRDIDLSKGQRRGLTDLGTLEIGLICHNLAIKSA